MAGTIRARGLAGPFRFRFLLALLAVAVPLATGALHAPARAAAVTFLSNQASPSGFPVGVGIYDSATLYNGVNATGTITFRLYGPSDPACTGGPIFTATTPVQGNGYYASAYYTTTVAGTYRWTAEYSGDSGNLPFGPTLCLLDSSAVTVAKRTPTLTNQAQLWGVTGPISNMATLNGAGPTGSLTFRLFGPGDMMCTAAIYTTVRTATGSGSYIADSFSPSVQGTYQWTIAYSGDSNNNATATMCGDPAGAVTIGPASAVSLTVSPGSAAPATWVRVTWTGIVQPTSGDWIALIAADAPDSAVRAWKYTTGTASGGVNLRVPWGTPPGAYEIRLFANNSTLRLAEIPLIVT